MSDWDTLEGLRRSLPGYEQHLRDLAMRTMVGPLEMRPHFDRVRVGSTATSATLNTKLPVARLQAAAHEIAIGRMAPNSKYWSYINLTVAWASARNVLRLLRAQRQLLKTYAVLEAEIAYDIPASSIGEALAILIWIAARLGKRRHQRMHLRAEYEPNQKHLPPGKLPGPTIYFEDARSTVRLKLYARREKLPAGQFGEPIVRLEWTLKGAAIADHLGGRSLSHLLNADLMGFLHKQLVLEEVNHAELGKVLFPRTISDEGRARRGSHLFLRKRAERDRRKLGGRTRGSTKRRMVSRDIASLVAHHNPAQIRGYLRELQRSFLERGLRQRGRLRITNHRIDKCFRQIELPAKRRKFRYRLETSP